MRGEDLYELVVMQSDKYDEASGSPDDMLLKFVWISYSLTISIYSKVNSCNLNIFGSFFVVALGNSKLNLSFIWSLAVWGVLTFD